MPDSYLEHETNKWLSLFSTAYEQGQESVLNEIKHTATEIFDDGAGTDMAFILADKLKEKLLIHTK